MVEEYIYRKFTIVSDPFDDLLQLKKHAGSPGRLIIKSYAGKIRALFKWDRYGKKWDKVTQDKDGAIWV